MQQFVTTLAGKRPRSLAASRDPSPAETGLPGIKRIQAALGHQQRHGAAVAPGINRGVGAGRLDLSGIKKSSRALAQGTGFNVFGTVAAALRTARDTS
jgi:hypothetical protein